MSGTPLYLAILYVRFLRYYQKVHNLIIPLFKKKNEPKVFCIGDVKTGTSSLYKALNILGYRTVRLLDLTTWHTKGSEYYTNKLKKYNYDAYVDFPMGCGDLYQKLDQAFPKSKFILTIREIKSYEKSYANYFSRFPIAKNPQELKQRMQKYDEHNKQAIEYFKDKPSQLLVLNVIEGDGWDKLCNFLDKPIPNKPFPHKNIGRYKK